MPPDPIHEPTVLEDPIGTSGQPDAFNGVEELDFEKINDDAPADAEPFVEPEEAPRNDEVEEPN